jgi:hypothetical protein
MKKEIKKIVKSVVKGTEDVDWKTVIVTLLLERVIHKVLDRLDDLF